MRVHAGSQEKGFKISHPEALDGIMSMLEGGLLVGLTLCAVIEILNVIAFQDINMLLQLLGQILNS